MAIAFPKTAKQDIRRAAAVLRVSTEKQTADDKDSVGRQRSLADDLAERYGWSIQPEHIYDETADKGYQSGRDRLEDRPYIQTMLEAARAGEFDVVIFKNPSRQSREATELLNLARELRELGVFIAYSDGNGAVLDYDDDMEQLVIFMGGWQAGTDWKQILNDMASGRHGAARNGRWFTGLPPTGYQLSETKTLIVNKTEAEYIRYAFARAAAGDSIEQTMQKLNGRFPEYRGKRGGVGFHPSSVGRWLRNPLYMGSGTKVSVAPRTGAPHETFTIPAPALVSLEMFEDARRNLVRNVSAWRPKSGKAGRKKVTPPYALSGGRLIHMHGSGLTADFSGVTRSDGARRYRCSHSVKRYRVRWGPVEAVEASEGVEAVEARDAREGFDACDGFGVHPVKRSVKLTSLNAAEVEAYVLLDVLEFVSRPEAIKEAREREDRRGEAASSTKDSLEHAFAEREALRGQRSTLVKQLRRLTEAEAEEAFADLEADELMNGERISRLENEAQYLAGIRISIEEILTASVSILGVQPGDETVRNTDSGPTEGLVVELGWEDVLSKVKVEAQSVIDGERGDLNGESVEWLSYMVDAWDLRAVVRDEGETYSVTLEGRPDACVAATDCRSVRRSAKTSVCW